MQPPPKKGPCGCGAPSVMCVHGSDGAFWLCKECFNRLLKIVQKKS